MNPTDKFIENFLYSLNTLDLDTIDKTLEEYKGMSFSQGLPDDLLDKVYTISEEFLEFIDYAERKLLGIRTVLSSKTLGCMLYTRLYEEGIRLIDLINFFEDSLQKVDIIIYNEEFPDV